MTETPEKVELKKLLGRLKEKSLSSFTNYTNAVKRYQEVVWHVTKKLGAASDIKPDDSALMADLKTQVRDLAENLNRGWQTLILRSLDVCDDLKFYTESLESYSAGLDNTLTEIFEQAMKAAEERAKQREELMKKEPSYRA